MDPTIFDRTLDDIRINNVKFCTINAKTGTGKSTILPIKLVQRDSKKKLKVFYVTPFVEGVRNMYERVSSNLVTGCNVDFSVGFAAHSLVNYHNNKISQIRHKINGLPLVEQKEDTQLVYCTTGHFLHVLRDCIKYIQNTDGISPRVLNICDYVIIDEPHRHSKDIDITLGMLKYMLVTFYDKIVPNVICTSATYNEEKLYMIPSPHNYNVDVLYTDFPHNLSFDQRINIMGEKIAEILSTRQPSTCLVFLPGIREIYRVRDDIRGSENSLNITFDIVIAHSKSSKEEKSRIYSPNDPNKWKIILATNMIEQSTTIDTATLAFDSMIEKFNETGPNETIYLKYGFISKDSAEQRKGRLGRTRPGTIIRLINQTHFNSLAQTVVPELERLPITNELLTVLDCNIDVRFIFGDINNGIERSMSHTQATKINTTIRRLVFLGILQKCDDYYRLTEMGSFLSSSSLNVKSRIFIYKWIENGYPIYPAIVLSVMIENCDTMFNTISINSEFVSDIPLASILLPWLKFCSSYGKLKLPEKLINKFCEKYGLNFDGWSDCIRKIKETILYLKSLEYEVDLFMFDPLEVFKLAKPFLDRMYFNYMIKPESNPTVYVSVNNKIKHTPLFLNKRFLSFDDYKPPEKVVSIMNLQISGKSQIILWYPLNYKFPMKGIKVDLDVKEESDQDNDNIEEEDDFDNVIEPSNYVDTKNEINSDDDFEF